jgi:hypothetical protein
MDVDVLDTLCLGGLDEGEEVADVRVNTTVRDQTTEVDSRTVLLGPFERCNDVGLLGELLLLDA